MRVLITACLVPLLALAGCAKKQEADEAQAAADDSAVVAGEACPATLDWLPVLIQLPPDCIVVSLTEPGERSHRLQMTSSSAPQKLVADYAGELYMEGYVVKQQSPVAFEFSGPDVELGRMEKLESEVEGRAVIQVDVTTRP